MIASFLKAAIGHNKKLCPRPDIEETPLLALADWLDERGDPRGALLRRRLALYQKWHRQREELLNLEKVRGPHRGRDRLRYKIRKADERFREWLVAQFCPNWPYWAKWTFPDTAR